MTEQKRQPISLSHEAELLMRIIDQNDPAARAEARRRDELLSHGQPRFCGTCGAEVWPLKGTEVLTCHRGHHQPNLWGGGAA